MEKEMTDIKRRRPHHRPVMLTIGRAEYNRLKSGHTVNAACANDIIRTSRCGAENEHHWERRVTTVDIALRNGWKKMNARWNGDEPAIKVEVLKISYSSPDDPYFIVQVKMFNN